MQYLIVSAQWQAHNTHTHTHLCTCAHSDVHTHTHRIQRQESCCHGASHLAETNGKCEQTNRHTHIMPARHMLQPSCMRRQLLLHAAAIGHVRMGNVHQPHILVIAAPDPVLRLALRLVFFCLRDGGFSMFGIVCPCLKFMCVIRLV